MLIIKKEGCRRKVKERVLCQKKEGLYTRRGWKGGGEKPINLSLPGMITVRHYTQSIVQTSSFKGSDFL